MEKLDESKKFRPRHIGFVLGNGTSRESISPEQLVPNGIVYGCNALYRSFRPDYLIAVDVKMILEIKPFSINAFDLLSFSHQESVAVG